MSIEKAIEDCEIYLKQMMQYDPDPYYVNYFFDNYINSVNQIIDKIFEEGNKDFGLFITEKISQETFEEKSRVKNDKNAIKFSEWFLIKYKQEHENPIPNFIKRICQIRKANEKMPKIKIMLRASERYKDDVYQKIQVSLSQEKLRSKEELEIEIKRQLPSFLEIINHKRTKYNEPKVKEKQVTASAFLDTEEFKDIEIVYAAEIYIPVIKRLVDESRKKIKELTTWG